MELSSTQVRTLLGARIQREPKAAAADGAGVLPRQVRPVAGPRPALGESNKLPIVIIEAVSILRIDISIRPRCTA